MKNKRNYYRILHVQFDAPPSVINSSYRTIMQKLRAHPDLGGDEVNARLLNEARDVLLNPELRAEYDLQLKSAGNSSGRREEQTHTESDVGGRPNRDHEESDDTIHSGPDTADSEPEIQEDLALFPSHPQCLFCHNPISPKQPILQEYPTSYRCTRCDAPLQKIENHLPENSSDLRKINRSAFEQPVMVWDEWPCDTGHSAIVRDWSTSGCSIELNYPVKANSVLLLVSPAFDSVATVRYQSDNVSDKLHVGLEFITLELKMYPGSIFVSAA